jgi:hypothetical protein
METSVLLSDCAGFSQFHISTWDSLKKGMPRVGTAASTLEDDSLYICFDESESSASLASGCCRLKAFVGPDAILRECDSTVFSAILSSKLFESPAACMDLIGAAIFRSPDRLIILPPVLEFDLTDLVARIDSIALPEDSWTRRRIREMGKLVEQCKNILTLILMRDLYRMYDFQGRSIPRMIEKAAQPFATIKTPQSMNAKILEVKQNMIVDVSREEWEQRVAELYNRSPRPFFGKIPSRKDITRKSKRKRKAIKSLDPDIEADFEIEQADEGVKLVVDNWLQCDHCSKWRVVDSETAASFEDKFFSCSQAGRNCEDPSDDQT